MTMCFQAKYTVLSALTALFLLPVSAFAQAQAAVPQSGAEAAPTRPVVPPWVEALSMVHATDYITVVPNAGEQIWEPGIGALPMLANSFGGPSSGVLIDLATGNLTYLPKPDLSVYNPNGSEVDFSRSYRSEAAARGYGSPGLPAGWVHIWDVTIAAMTEGDTKPDSHADLILTYPNGVHERIQWEIGPDGRPTGKFAHPSGRPFLVSGVTSATTPVLWDHISITWPDESQWTFLLSSDQKTYVLCRVDDLLIVWDDSRRLRSVRSAHAPQGSLISFAYDPNSGLLTSVTDFTKRVIGYVYQTPPPSAGIGNAPGLVAVTIVRKVGDKPEPYYAQVYGYTIADGKPFLNSVGVPGNKDYSTATVTYTAGRITSLVDGNLNRHVYTYLPTGTRVDVWGKASGKIDGSWTENIDAMSRHTGTTDAAGHSTSIKYGN